MNRNIETRIEKQPILSDLKESGCVKYTHNINLISLLNKNSNQINFVTTYKKLTKANIVNSKNILLKNLKLEFTKLNSKSQIHISSKYVFRCKISRKILSLTNNHKYLFIYNWIKTRKILDYTKVNYIKMSDHKNLRKNNIINLEFIQMIKFEEYSKSYDLNVNNYFNFVCKHIILHNSIEQDADIVVMIYENTNNTILLKDKKILDLVICKNRNGPTGSCKIIFIPKINLFQNLSPKYTTNKNLVPHKK